MVDGGVELQLLGDVTALFGTAGDAHRAGPGHLGELPHERADRAACRRDGNRFARRRLADDVSSPHKL
jgi:hypothetical protein